MLYENFREEIIKDDKFNMGLAFREIDYTLDYFEVLFAMNVKDLYEMVVMPNAAKELKAVLQEDLGVDFELFKFITINNIGLHNYTVDKMETMVEEGTVDTMSFAELKSKYELKIMTDTEFMDLFRKKISQMHHDLRNCVVNAKYDGNMRDRFSKFVVALTKNIIMDRDIEKMNEFKDLRVIPEINALFVMFKEYANADRFTYLINELSSLVESKDANVILKQMAKDIVEANTVVTETVKEEIETLKKTKEAVVEEAAKVQEKKEEPVKEEEPKQEVKVEEPKKEKKSEPINPIEINFDELMEGEEKTVDIEINPDEIIAQDEVKIEFKPDDEIEINLDVQPDSNESGDTKKPVKPEPVASPNLVDNTKQEDIDDFREALNDIIGVAVNGGPGLVGEVYNYIDDPIEVELIKDLASKLKIDRRKGLSIKAAKISPNNPLVKDIYTYALDQFEPDEIALKDTLAQYLCSLAYVVKYLETSNTNKSPIRFANENEVPKELKDVNELGEVKIPSFANMPFIYTEEDKLSWFAKNDRYSLSVNKDKLGWILQDLKAMSCTYKG